MLFEVLLVAVVLKDHLGVAVDQPISALHLRGVQLVLQLLALPAARDWHRQTFYDHQWNLIEVLLNVTGIVHTHIKNSELTISTTGPWEAMRMPIILTVVRYGSIK